MSELLENDRGEDNILCSVEEGFGDFIYNEMILEMQEKGLGH